MAITVACPACVQACSVADEHAGMQVRCPKCGGVIQVPNAGIPTAAPLPAGPGVSTAAP